MELKFDSNLDYQLKAIESVIYLFAGQPRFEFKNSTIFSAVPNSLTLSEAEVLQNLQLVQDGNGITPDKELQFIEDTITTRNGGEQSRFYNFSVEMETGTGKTYVYLRTILELFRHYGMRKFIIVVPSIAIKEGVLKTLDITKKHFEQLFGKVPYSSIDYDSENLSQVRQFALSNSIEIMVMTLAAFNKATNVIRNPTDRLSGDTPIHLIQAVRPILILDEPQNMESEKSIQALAILNPLFALRYSATHRNPYNIIYRLTPYEAYRQGLVKRIEVASVIREDDTAQPYIRLVGVKSEKTRITAQLAVQTMMSKGIIKEKTFSFKPGDSLETKTKRREYVDYTIDEINPGGKFIRFGNNIELRVGEEIGANKDAIFEAQIRYTIEEHFRKQKRLKSLGLKVLSLFFIDRVNNYVSEDGIIRKLFTRIFNEEKKNWPEWSGLNPEDVSTSYFSQKNVKGQTIYEDSRGESKEDREAYDLIMKDKERLLSFIEPRAFVFSHSALREGWDNPNIFQICTLNQTSSEIKKRQEIGRGIRLSVNQTGDRVFDESVNVLTVSANQSYDRFVSQYQSEIALDYQDEIEKRYGKSIANLTDEERSAIAAEYGKDILPPTPTNARSRSVSRLQKARMLSPEFKGLWEKIKHKTRYSVTIDTPKLITQTCEELNTLTLPKPRVTITKIQVQVTDENVFDALQISQAKSVMSLVGRFPVPNAIDKISYLLENTTPKVSITRATIFNILSKMDPSVQQQMMDSPDEFANAASRVIKKNLADQMVDGIQYTKTGEWYTLELFEDVVDSWSQYLLPVKHSLYDNIIFNSQIERDFAKGLEKRDDVKLYIKLPNWFTIQTPIGEYNPDWAIAIEERDEHGESKQRLIFLIAETKGTTDESKLRLDEKRKFRCGKRHFKDALKLDKVILAETVNDI